jgi:hypothetical protein
VAEVLARDKFRVAAQPRLEAVDFDEATDEGAVGLAAGGELDGFEGPDGQPGGLGGEGVGVTEFGGHGGQRGRAGRWERGEGRWPEEAGPEGVGGSLAGAGVGRIP